jgi:hypothetical protein
MKVDLDTFADSILLLPTSPLAPTTSSPPLPTSCVNQPPSSISFNNFHPLRTPPSASPLPSSATSWGIEATPPVSTLNLFPAHTLVPSLPLKCMPLTRHCGWVTPASIKREQTSHSHRFPQASIRKLSYYSRKECRESQRSIAKEKLLSPSCRANHLLELLT